MSILDGLLSRLGYVPNAYAESLKAAAEFQAPQWLQATAQAERWTLPPATTAERQAALYANLTWIQIAISHVARMVAGTKLSVKRLEGEEEADIPNHPFETLLRRPNPLMSRFELMVSLVSYFCATGNSYLWTNRPGPDVPPLELWVLPAQKVQPIPDGQMFISGYKYTPGHGFSDPVPPLPVWSVCHFKEFNPLNPFVGLSKLQALSMVSAGDLAQQRWNTNYFDKDNAKVPGALAFKDPIQQGAWDQMKADVKQDWGGTNRSGPMMLRNAGTGVSWLQMAFNQKEMEFLESRRFTKEEIFNQFAPGLASVLDVNATEANALAGKATLIEMAVWPLCVMFAEKLTNDLLPVYGTDIVCEFDDIRIADRLINLNEQKEYSRTHTVDEVRQEYYSDPGIGDERGRLTPDEILAMARKLVPTPAEIGAGETADGTPASDTTAQDVTAQDVTAGAAVPGADQTALAGKTEIFTIRPKLGDAFEASLAKKVQDDLAFWERKCINAMKRGKSPGEVVFKTSIIAPWLYAKVEDGLILATTLDEVGKVFEEARPTSMAGGFQSRAYP